MSWNIFKRIALLEQQVKDLTDFNGDKSRWIMRLEQKIRHIEDKFFISAVDAFSAAPVRSEGEPVFTKDEVDQEKERKRQYQREWYVKNKGKINEQRIINRKIKEAEEKKKHGKAYYWKNRERVLAYSRAYYQKKKAKTEV